MLGSAEPRWEEDIRIQPDVLWLKIPGANANFTMGFGAHREAHNPQLMGKPPYGVISQTTPTFCVPPAEAVP